MQRAILFFIIIQGTMFSNAQIIVDHQAVSEFDSIPEVYIAEVKKMMVAFPGESHSAAMRHGMELLEAEDATYACNVSEGQAYTDQYVRVEDLGWIGELEWFTWFAYDEGNRPYPARVIFKNIMEDYHANGHPITALGFTWCYDMVIGDGNETEGSDPDHGVHWYGTSIGGPDGDMGWGLDEDDYVLTGNRVNLKTYFGAMEEYIDYSNSNGLGTKVIFTTGTVDFEGEWWGEGGYQGHIKHEAIRNYVMADTSRILFDYADILCHDNDGTMNTRTWNGYTYPSITSTNEVPRNLGHISDAGALRLAKAQWWMLARIAGWEGVIYGDDIAPTVPSGLAVVSMEETSVSLSWNASSDDVGVSGYSIYRSGTLLGSTSTISYTDNSLSTCGDYSYTITAYDDAANESDQSAALEVHTCSTTDNSPPTVPSGLAVVSMEETSVSLSWNSSSDDVGVSGYRIYRSGTLLGSTSALSYTDNSLSTCGDYSYTVTAYDDAANESDQSAAVYLNTCLPDDIGSSSAINDGSVNLAVYPNPSGSRFMIDPGQTIGRFTLEIIASSGQRVLLEELEFDGTPKSVNMEINEPGIYYIRVFNGEMSFSGKHVLAR